MKWIRDNLGGRNRLWYDDSEIEQLVVARTENYYASSSSMPLDLEVFAEQYCGVGLYQHETLPDNVLGFTEFLPNQRCNIYLNRTITMSTEVAVPSISAVGRWRATIAHELGHVFLHRILYDQHENQLGLLIEDSLEKADSNLQCAQDTVGLYVAAGDWREVQANKAMASLLMPRTHFTLAFDRFAEANRGAVTMRNLVAELSKLFLVSRQATEIRIAELGLTISATRLV